MWDIVLTSYSEIIELRVVKRKKSIQELSSREDKIIIELLS